MGIETKNTKLKIKMQKTDELTGIKALLQFLKERRQQRRLNLRNG